MKNTASGKMVSHMVSLSLVMIALIVSSVTLLRSLSAAWFAENKKVDAENMQVKADSFDITMTYYRKDKNDSDYVEIDSFNNIFEGMLPGDIVWLKIAYDSKEDVSHNATVFMSSFDECEKPIRIGENYYYFSSQLKIMETNQYLLDPPQNSVSYTQEQSLPNREIGDVSVKANTITEFEFSIQFVNYTDVDQNTYQNFGLIADEFCYRIITSDFS